MNGVIAWALLIAIFCGPALVARLFGASPSTRPVSGNPPSEKWEQIEPFDECFEEDDL